LRKDLEVIELVPNMVYDITLWCNLIHVADPLSGIRLDCCCCKIRNYHGTTNPIYNTTYQKICHSLPHYSRLLNLYHSIPILFGFFIFPFFPTHHTSHSALPLMPFIYLVCHLLSLSRINITCGPSIHTNFNFVHLFSPHTCFPSS